MKLVRNIVLSLSAAFLIIGIHQTIVLGFEVSYWIFMLTISMFLFYRLLGNSEKDKEKKKKVKKVPKEKKSKKKDQMVMNRQAKRHMERMK